MRSLAHAPNGAGAAVYGNRILGGLEADDLRLLEPVDVMRMPARYVLLEADEPIRHLYFPASGVVSLVQLDGRGSMPEVAQAGTESVVGAAALLGAERARYRAVVRLAGAAYRVTAASARRAFDQSRAFQALVLGYADLLIRQLAQSVVCKLSHSVEQQLCQHLLVYADRMPGTALEMTHEQIAEALGSRRQGITEAARRLQAQGIIAYSRGRISVLDRPALERRACDCYRNLRGAL